MKLIHKEPCIFNNQYTSNRNLELQFVIMKNDNNEYEFYITKIGDNKCDHCSLCNNDICELYHKFIVDCDGYRKAYGEEIYQFLSRTGYHTRHNIDTEFFISFYEFLCEKYDKNNMNDHILHKLDEILEELKKY